MSGRKQHYLPQFLQRRFGRASGTKGVSVRYNSKSRTFVSSTENIGAEKDFYSPPSDTVDTLDIRITEFESRYAGGLSAADRLETFDLKSFCELVVHLSARGDGVRQHWSTLIDSVMKQVFGQLKSPATAYEFIGLDEYPLPEALKSSVNDVYNKNGGRINGIKIARHDFYLLCRRMIQENWSEIHMSVASHVSMLENAIDIREISASSHNDVLFNNITSSQRVEHLLPYQWRIASVPEFLILPDAAAVALCDGGLTVPYIFSSFDNFRGLLFPIGSGKLACCGDGISLLGHGTAAINEMLATGSVEFFLSNPDDTEATRFIELIGRGTADQLESLVREGVLKECLRPWDTTS